MIDVTEVILTVSVVRVDTLVSDLDCQFGDVEARREDR